MKPYNCMQTNYYYQIELLMSDKNRPLVVV